MVTRGQAYLESLAGRRVTVVGLARSGVAAARLLRAVGAQVTGIDLKPLEALGREAAALQTLGVRLLTGKETRGAFDGADLVVVSPGVPLDGDQLVPARAVGVPIIGELELGWRSLEAETIAITGTHGKTTTTALTGALLAEQPPPLPVAANIGTPPPPPPRGFPPDLPGGRDLPAGRAERRERARRDGLRAVDGPRARGDATGDRPVSGRRAPDRVRPRSAGRAVLQRFEGYQRRVHAQGARELLRAHLVDRWWQGQGAGLRAPRHRRARARRPRVPDR